VVMVVLVVVLLLEAQQMDWELPIKVMPVE
jgi:hypothetical protein